MAHSPPHVQDALASPERVRAVLGPTNTGKTHYAVERMIAHSSGVIGLPLRLLAREVYDRIVDLKGVQQVALVTGEEKIIPKRARYFVCTVEAMPSTLPDGHPFAFLAIDEVQLMDHPERGHIFTDRVLHARGSQETLLLGAETARSLIHHLLGKAVMFDHRERFSTLAHVGPLRLTRLPKRSVIVAFSASEVYALAELIRRYRGGAAVVMGKLSPRTRNAQAELYQSGEVDFLVATDAVGMGLNLDADHVAFANLRKFDGHRRRWLTHMEAAQIAGRAGRFRNHGTFGTTADAPEMDEAMVAAIEGHRFEPIHRAQWRSNALDFSSIEALRDSLHVRAPSRRLRRVAPASDELSLDRLAALPEVRAELSGPATVKRLWDICQIPDFRDLTIDAHVRLLCELHDQMVTHRGRIPHKWMEARVARLDDTTGGVDILSQRLAQIRTWTYCAHKVDWMFDPGHWQTRTRTVEDRLSDALHESLIERFVDRRTSALMKGIGANDHMSATIKDNGEVWVDDHRIGHLHGLKFTLDESGSDLEAKALQAAATKAITPEIDRRLTSMSGAAHAIYTLSDEGEILWGGKPVGRIAKSGSVFNPAAEIIGGDYGNPQLVAMAEERLRQYLAAEVSDKLAPLTALRNLSNDPDTRPDARGFAYQMVEQHGSVSRDQHSRDIRALNRDARSALWSVGVVFGQYDVFLRDMLKPKPARLLSLLLAYGAGGDGKPYIPFAGMTSVPDPDGEIARSHSTDAIRTAGYRVCGPRIVRFDILERLGRMIRQAQHDNKTGKGFQIMMEMLALIGGTYEEMQGVLSALGYVSETREPATPPQPVSETPDGSAPATGETSTEAAPAAPDAETTSAKKRRKGRTPEELHVFNHRETRDDGTVIEHPNTEYWLWKRQPQKGENPSRGGAPSRRKGKGGQKPPRGQRSPRKSGPTKVEDSPFAALADLKLTKDKS